MGGKLPALGRSNGRFVLLTRDCLRYCCADLLRSEDGIPGVAKTPEEYHAFLDRLVEEIKAIGYAPELRMITGRKPL